MDLVSIVIPAYNAERHLRAAIDSALAQTWRAREIIVVDDGSVDATQRILQSYGTAITVLTQRNRGAAAATNVGVATARGTWIAFLDADDIWLPDKLSRQIERCGGYAISHTDSVCFGESIEGEIKRSGLGVPCSGFVVKELLVTNCIVKSTVLIRRELYERLGGFDETMAGVEDWSLWLAACADNELGYLPEVTVRYRVHSQSKSMETRKTLVDHLRIIDAAFAPGGVGRRHPALRRRALASSYHINAHYAAQTGDWRFALRCAACALLHEPASAHHWRAFAKCALGPLGVPY
jgi:glycosyltransferase involved in cell wall biosynthesis